MTHRALSIQISQKQDRHNIYAFMKTMCPPGYHHNGFVATDALGHITYDYTLLVMYITVHNCVYITEVILNNIK